MKTIHYLRHLFIPDKHNNFRAKALHHDFLTYYLIFAVLLVFAFKTVRHNFSSVLGFATDITVEKLFVETNTERGKNSLPPLSYNEKLSKAAELKAHDMFEKNYWAHYSPKGSTPWEFILESDYQYEYAGENLAKNFLFSQGVIDAWMKSPTHRENIVRKEYSDMGLAVVNGILNGEETTLVVQMFAKPLNDTLSQVTKKTGESISPVPVEKTVVKQDVLSKTISAPLISNNAQVPFDIVYLFIFFLILVLVIDFYVVSSMHIVRLTGKNIAHIIFLGFVITGIVLFVTKGSII